MKDHYKQLIQEQLDDYWSLDFAVEYLITTKEIGVNYMQFMQAVSEVRDEVNSTLIPFFTSSANGTITKNFKDEWIT